MHTMGKPIYLCIYVLFTAPFPTYRCDGTSSRAAKCLSVPSLASAPDSSPPSPPPASRQMPSWRPALQASAPEEASSLGGGMMGGQLVPAPLRGASPHICVTDSSAPLPFYPFLDAAGVVKYGVPLSLDSKLKVDLIVVGSSVVDRNGARLGKGEVRRRREEWTRNKQWGPRGPGTGAWLPRASGEVEQR